MAAAQHVPLSFDQNVQPTNAQYPNNSTLGPDYYNGQVFDFTDVAILGTMAVDARVSLTATAGSYELVGWLPNYDTIAGEPAGDLGVYHRFTGDYAAPAGGISFRIDFFEGGGQFLVPVALPAFRLLFYDHDGEPTQSEAIRTYLGDGFIGYQLYQGSGITAVDEGGSFRFNAGGLNQPEAGPEGGLLAYYQNTGSVSIDMLTTSSATPFPNYGVFVAIDGDLSLTGGSTDPFAPYVPVPEPSAAVLLAAAGGLACRRRRRSHSGEPGFWR